MKFPNGIIWLTKEFDNDQEYLDRINSIPLKIGDVIWLKDKEAYLLVYTIIFTDTEVYVCRAGEFLNPSYADHAVGLDNKYDPFDKAWYKHNDIAINIGKLYTLTNNRLNDEDYDLVTHLSEEEMNECYKIDSEIFY